MTSRKRNAEYGMVQRNAAKIFFALMLIGLVLVGCSSNNSGNNSDGTSENGAQSSLIDTTDDSQNPKEYTLATGNHVAGIDIPAGTCKVLAVSGIGNLYSSNYDGEGNGVNEMFGIDDGSGVYIPEFDGLTLSEDEVLELSGTLSVSLTYSEETSSFSGRTYDESAAMELGVGSYTAGVEFPAGTYKIVANSGTGTLYSPDYEGGVDEDFGIDDGSGFYLSQFVNLELLEDETLEISGDLSVKLIPATTATTATEE